MLEPLKQTGPLTLNGKKLGASEGLSSSPRAMKWVWKSVLRKQREPPLFVCCRGNVCFLRSNHEFRKFQKLCCKVRMLPKEQSDQLWRSYLCDAKTFNCRRDHMRALQKRPRWEGLCISPVHLLRKTQWLLTDVTFCHLGLV